MVLKYLSDINIAVRYKIVRLGTKLFGIMKVSPRCAVTLTTAQLLGSLAGSRLAAKRGALR
jgi:hypothetical protein